VGLPSPASVRAGRSGCGWDAPLYFDEARADRSERSGASGAAELDPHAGVVHALQGASGEAVFEAGGMRAGE